MNVAATMRASRVCLLTLPLRISINIRQPDQPQLRQRVEITRIGSTQRLEISLLAGIVSSRIHRRQSKLVAQCDKQDAPGSAVEILVRMYPLEAPIHPRQQCGNVNCTLQVTQTLVKVKAEIPDVDGELVAGRRQMRPHLNIGAAKTSRPIREQSPCDTAVNATNPFRRDADVIGRFFQQGIEAMRDIHRDAFRHLGVAKRTGSRRQFARGI